MTIGEYIICFGFVAAVILFAFVLFWFVIIRPIANYQVNKKKHKIQWKCEKSKDELDWHDYNLYYRTLPSELNKFIRIYGENYWVHVHKFDNCTFYDKEDFINFVKPYKTRKEIEDYLEGESGWIYP